MKAISLWQPWASFIAAGLKPFETRDWAPPVGLIEQRIAIHASKKIVSNDGIKWARSVGVTELPRGMIVCTAILAGAYQCGSTVSLGTRKIVTIVDGIVGSRGDLSIVLDEFGDYYPGRWAWWLTDIERVAPPVPAVGRQRIWNWEG